VELLDVEPVVAKSAFKNVLRADSILGADEVLEASFAVRDGHLECGRCKSATDALEKGEIRLGVLDSECFCESCNEAGAPNGPSGATEDVLIAFNNVKTRRAFVCLRLSNPVHVSSSR
jgi:hypothetical protein